MKNNKLTLIYDKRQKDFVVHYPARCDGALIFNHFLQDNLSWRFPDKTNDYPFNFVKENFMDELEKRGYDIKTLRFSIELKKE
jgi:hypothetical protein